MEYRGDRRKREKQTQRRELDPGLNPRSPVSHPGPKADAKPLNHPGAPEFFLITKYIQVWDARPIALRKGYN